MTNQSLPASLWVYLDGDRIGTLYPTNPLSFEYTEEWVAEPNAAALYPDIPVKEGRVDGAELNAFFENLLPEGDQRKIISLQQKVSSVYGLLAKVGGDTAGSVVLLPEGEKPEDAVYKGLDWGFIRALLRGETAAIASLEAETAGLPKPRISISGAQLKMLLLVDAAGRPHKPMGSSPSTHILKPDMVRNDVKVFATAANETIVMRAARICELPTADVSYQPETQACLIERYDRVEQGGKIRRLWQADFCQLLGKPSDVKYEHDGGPTFKDCYDLLDMSAEPAVDRRNLLRWLFFNLYVGNHDSHAKNLSMLTTHKGLKLAPFYDLMSTNVYSGLGPSFAFQIGGEYEPGKLTSEHLVQLATDLGVAARYVVRIASEMAERVVPAIKTAASEVEPHVGHSHKVLVERIVRHIGKNVKQLRKRLLPTEAASTA